MAGRVGPEPLLRIAAIVHHTAMRNQASALTPLPRAWRRRGRAPGSVALFVPATPQGARDTRSGRGWSFARVATLGIGSVFPASVAIAISCFPRTDSRNTGTATCRSVVSSWPPCSTHGAPLCRPCPTSWRSQAVSRQTLHAFDFCPPHSRHVTPGGGSRSSSLFKSLQACPGRLGHTAFRYQGYVS